jgi:hypothetical protein
MIVPWSSEYVALDTQFHLLPLFPLSCHISKRSNCIRIQNSIMILILVAILYIGLYVPYTHIRLYSLILSHQPSSRGRWYYYLHFTSEEAETQKCLLAQDHIAGDCWSWDSDSAFWLLCKYQLSQCSMRHTVVALRSVLIIIILIILTVIDTYEFFKSYLARWCLEYKIKILTIGNLLSAHILPIL